MSIGSDEFEKGAGSKHIALGERVANTKPIELPTVELPSLPRDLSLADAKECLASLGSKDTAIYAISLPDAKPSDVHEAMQRARAEKVGERSYARLLALPENPSTTLYVGSSRTLQKRILEHLGFKHRQTSSLHMMYWYEAFGKVVVEARVYDQSVENDVLCALEDHLAALRVPLFGRRGSV